RRDLLSFPTRRSSDLRRKTRSPQNCSACSGRKPSPPTSSPPDAPRAEPPHAPTAAGTAPDRPSSGLRATAAAAPSAELPRPEARSEGHTSELQSRQNL